MASLSYTTIADLVPEVQKLLGNRSDIGDQAPYWIRDCLLEVTENYVFDELRVNGPQFNLTAGTYSYDLSNFLLPGDFNYSQLPVFVMYFNYPQNTVPIPLVYQQPIVVESVSTFSGPPTMWTRFGNNLIFGLNPDKTYTVYCKYQRQHPVNDKNLGATPIMILRSWLQVIKFGAAIIGSVILRMPDYTSLYYATLYGDAKYVSSNGRQGRPGIIARLTTQPERDKEYNSQGFGMSLTSYNYGGGY